MVRAIGSKKTVVADPEERRVRAGDYWLDGFFPYRLYRTSIKLQLRLQGRLRAMRMSHSAHAHADAEAAISPNPLIQRVEARRGIPGREGEEGRTAVSAEVTR